MKKARKTKEQPLIQDKHYDEQLKEFVYLVKWPQTYEFKHDTWEWESMLLREYPNLVISYNDCLE